MPNNFNDQFNKIKFKKKGSKRSAFTTKMKILEVRVSTFKKKGDHASASFNNEDKRLVEMILEIKNVKKVY